MRKILVGALVVAMMSFASSSASNAETSKGKNDKERELPKSGTLSESRSTGAVSNSVDESWGGIDTEGKSAAPITGSVSRINPTTWQVKVFNTSEDTYSVDLKVVQRDNRRTEVKSDSFGYTIRPGESKDRTLPAGVGATDAALELRSFKNLSKKKEKTTESAPDSDGAATK